MARYRDGVGMRTSLLRKQLVYGGALFLLLIGSASAAWAEIDSELVKKAEAGDAEAQFTLGMMYYNGDGGVISKAGLITLIPSGAVFLSPILVTSLAFLCSITTSSGLLVISKVEMGAAT